MKHCPLHGFVRAALAAWLFGPAGWAAPAPESRILYDTGFGQRFEPVTGYEGASGLLHEGWRENSDWSKAKLRYAVERITEEHTAQSVTLENPGSAMGQMQCLSNFPITAGKYYEIILGAKADRSAKIGVALRNPNPPYQPITLLKDFTVGSEWKTWRFVAKAEGPTDARLTVRFHDRATVILNRLTLREWAAPPPNEKTAQAPGNLLRNGDFRLGPYAWCAYSETPRDRDRFPRETLMRYSTPVPALTEEGARGLGMDIAPETISVLVSSFVPVGARQAFTASARVRRSEGSGPVVFKIFGLNWSKTSNLEKTVGTAWETLQLAGEFPDAEGLQVRAELSAGGSGKLFIDDVALVCVPAPPAPVFGAYPTKGLPLYPVGSPIEFVLRQAGASGSNVSWTLVDSEGRPSATGTWTLASSSQTVRLTQTSACGWYQLRWSAPWAKDSAGRASFGVVPPIERRAGPASPFGIHVEGSALGVEKMKLMGFQWLRSHNPLFTKWTAVQPRKDVWQYPDEYVDRFTKAKLSILGSLDRTPLWNARNPTNVRITDYLDYRADLPADLAAWRLYASNMAARYRDRIRFWEIWNEPDIIFLRPPPGMTHAEAYKLLVGEAAAAIKSVDPGLNVVGGPAYFFYPRSSYEGSQEDFTERLVENGGFAKLDIFGFHYYLKERRLLDISALPAQRLDFIRTAQTRAGKKPVCWDTEGGLIRFTASAFDLDVPASMFSIDQAADELTWFFASQLALGIEKIFWYDGQDNFLYNFHVTKNMFDYREPRPIAVAAAVLTWLLDGRTLVESRSLEGGRLLRFAGPSGAVSLAWALPGKNAKIRPEAGVVAFDSVARPVAFQEGVLVLSDKPVYLVSETESRVLTGRAP